MKEASGEASLTVVAIILIGVIAAVVTPLITSLTETTKMRACCMDAGGVWKQNQCSVNISNSDCVKKASNK